MAAGSGPDVFPSVSIIMPCRNEAASIARSLGSVLAQDYPPEQMQILIVDGMSEDRTRAVLQETLRCQQQPMTASRPGSDAAPQVASGRAVMVLDNPQRVVPVALNLGLAHAQGEIIFRLDGHSEMAPHYVRTCVATLLRRPDVACVGGPSLARGTGFLGRAYALALRSPFGVGGSTFRTLGRERYVDTLAFGAYRREVFTRLGGFDPDLHRNQDIAFNARLTKAGYRQLLIPETHTVYHAPESLYAILRQNFRNGYWNTKTLDKMLGVLSWRHFVPLGFVLFLLVSTIGVLGGAWNPLPLLVVGGLYGLGVFGASASLAARQHDWCVLLVPCLFPLMHVSYGLGALAGLCRYAVQTVRQRSRR